MTSVQGSCGWYEEIKSETGEKRKLGGIQDTFNAF